MDQACKLGHRITSQNKHFNFDVTSQYKQTIFTKLAL